MSYKQPSLVGPSQPFSMSVCLKNQPPASVINLQFQLGQFAPDLPSRPLPRAVDGLQRRDSHPQGVRLELHVRGLQIQRQKRRLHHRRRQRRPRGVSLCGLIGKLS